MQNVKGKRQNAKGKKGKLQNAKKQNAKKTYRMHHKCRIHSSTKAEQSYS
jgi:hypothetical protein